MNTHDPQKVIEDIRNHLAAQDRRVSFLFGAGTSSAVNIAPAVKPGEKRLFQPLIPDVKRLTEICRKAVCDTGEIQTLAWGLLVHQCEAEKKPGNIEQLLSKVRMRIDAIGDKEESLGLSREGLRGIEEVICAKIASVVSPPESSIPSRVPHDAFASWIGKSNRSVPIEIFTTNYDVLIERACELARVPVFDGFVGSHKPFFFPDCLDDETLLPNSRWVRLWKLHGSVNWAAESHRNEKRIVRGQPMESGKLILPSHRKYDESRKQPYMGYMDRLTKVLCSEHSLLVTCGYSFGDEHINAALYSALDSRATANVVALQYGDLNENDDLVKAALRLPNLSVIGFNGGVISGEWGQWQLLKPVDTKISPFLDLGFDSNGMPEVADSAVAESDDLRGNLRLGDFNWLCRFLNAMGKNLS